jgi:hypothetical protein
MSEDKPYVPKISTKPLPEHEKRTKAGRIRATREKGLPSQKDRLKKFGRELKKLNIHQPRYGVRAENIKAIKDVKEDEEVYQLSGNVFKGEYTKGTPTKTIKFVKTKGNVFRICEFKHEFITLVH